MLKNSTRRWLAGLGVAGAFVAASATPALAADPTIADAKGAEGFALYANDVIVAPGGPEKWISLYSLVDEPFTDYTVKVDRSAVDGFADVQAPDGCTPADAILTCTVKNDGEPDLDLLSLTVLPRDGAKAGQEGQLAFTVTTPNAGSASYRSTVTVGEGVDLTSEPFVQLTGTPGSTVKSPLAVGNQGKTDAKGAVLFFFGSYALAPAKRYENCEYFEDNFDTYAYACTLDATVAADGSAKLDDSFGFAIPGDAWAPNTDHGFAIWMTPADWQAFRSQVPDFGKSAKGDEGVLQLTPSAPAPALARAMGQTDVDPTNNETMIELTVKGNQKADVAASGATVDASVGATVPVTVGFTNNGPAAINAGGENGIYTLALVTVPKGTTAVKAPESCVDAEGEFGEDPGKPGASVYACFLPEVIGKGKKAQFPFSLRIDKAGSLAGKVELVHGGPDETLLKDLNPANDTAQILVNAAAGNGGGDGDGDGDGDGGTLPLTGSSTGLIAGIGGLLLLAGAGGYLVARRRRTHFVA
ncbi:LPXTG-motif cell wall anchor domain-containing protein [Micromonospora rhizosphaerae]|uniref:LPXTG-motif cell wall anchor domain-containing protein n=1 Tax=Micromonospora rhizosphaerae TaxID=568872 RepID=A0A1C6RHN5_9ACTN|nr:LPXTG cell wall anchor domain-containing protein [Micromonospora rhizosphaerae]SCL16511.1 LPXTG-motif cell wall anchor domain-containing protein [Micromonospora rhizosphaerae]